MADTEKCTPGGEKSKVVCNGLTSRDVELITIIFKHCMGGENASDLKVSSLPLSTIIPQFPDKHPRFIPDDLQFDRKALMLHGGFKTTNSANASWATLKKKLFGANVSKASADAKIPDSKTGSPGTGDVESGANDDTPRATPASPTVAKKPKTPRKRKTADTAKGGDAAEPAAKKPRARKPKGENGPKKGKGEVKKSSSPETHVMDPAQMKEEDGDETDDTVVKGEPIEDTVEAVCM